MMRRPRLKPTRAQYASGPGVRGRLVGSGPGCSEADIHCANLSLPSRATKQLMPTPPARGHRLYSESGGPAAGSEGLVRAGATESQ